MPGLKPMFRNSLSAEGAKAVKIKAWALKARMLMPNSGRFVRLCVVRLCVRLTILNLFKVYMNLSLRFFHFKFFKVLKQIMYLWFKWIMERCYPHLRWYFYFRNLSFSILFLFKMLGFETQIRNKRIQPFEAFWSFRFEKAVYPITQHFCELKYWRSHQ